MKKALILVNAYCEDKTNLNQSVRLAQELELLGVKTEVLKNDDFFAYIDNGEIKYNLENYDFCVYLDKDKYLSKMLESRPIRLFNSHSAIEICDDKMLTHIALSNKNIAMPKTLSGQLCYTKGSTVSEQTLDKIEKELAYPIVVKNSFGSLGAQVYLAKNRAELKSVAQKLIFSPHLFQEFIKESSGVDVRVIVVGGKPICAMKRVSNGDFRSNVELGGKGVPFKLNEQLSSLCEKVATVLNLDYCGIDILQGERGYMVCEVNSNAFFGGIEKVTGVNVAKIYAEYIYNEIYKEL